MLVGTDVWLPGNPRERFIDRAERIGCNRLFCGSCRSWIRHLDMYAFVTEPSAADTERLYFDRRAETYQGFRPSLPSRIYLCRCKCVEIAGMKSTSELKTIDSWTCAGHPSEGDASVTEAPPTDAQVESMLRTSAAGPPSFGDNRPWDFALRWRQPFIFDHVWPIVSRLLVDPDPVIRTRALELVHDWKDGAAMTVGRLIEVATNHADLFRAPSLQRDLCSTFSRKAFEVRSHRATIAKTIVTFLDGEPPRGAETLVSEYEPEAVIASANRWTESELDRSAAKEAASTMALYRRDHLLALLRALAGRSMSSREEILDGLASDLAITGDQLRSILSIDNLPQPQTAPTLDDCRRALGLTTS
jgi:hypothetical protein